MQRIKLLLGVTFMLILFLTRLQAQSIYVKNKNGTQTSFTLSSLQKLTFSGGNLTITKVNSTSESFDLNVVRYLNFVDLSTGKIPVKQESSNSFIFPNPVKDELTIHFPFYQEETIQVLIIGLDGKIIQHHILNCQSNSMQVSINTSSLTNGLYLCRLINGKTVTIMKFLKSK
jgi:hypothetical protein